MFHVYATLAHFSRAHCFGEHISAWIVYMIVIFVDSMDERKMTAHGSQFRMTDFTNHRVQKFHFDV